MAVLASIDRWPVPWAAAGVVVARAGYERAGDGRFGGGAPGPVVVETHQPWRAGPWASVTKLLTAMAVLVAVEEGIVGLDDPAGPPGSTVAHLLAHASGLAPDAPVVLAKPGTRRIYSNHGFEVLAGVVETAAAMPFATYVGEAVLDPLGMAATAFPIGASAASGASGPLGDLLRLAAELLAPRLVAASTLALATTVAFPGLAGVLPGYGRLDPCDWGLGFELKDAKPRHWTGRANSPATFGHFGRSGSLLWVDPVAQVACCCLAGRSFGPWAKAAWPALADAVLARYGPGAPAVAGR